MKNTKTKCENLINWGNGSGQENIYNVIDKLAKGQFYLQ